MSLFQSPPQNEAEYEAARPLAIGPDQVRDMDEKEWYDKIYRGEDVPQLTLRAVGMGSLLGFLLAFTNLYIGLKTGWGLGVAITACILAYAISNALVAAGVAKTRLTVLETNCMQSTASAAGYSTGSTMVSAIPALLMLSATDANPKGEHLPAVLIGFTIFTLGVLGTVMAIPMKRNLINQERLTFPSGTAAAVTLQSLYSAGDAAIRKANALMTAMAVSALYAVPLKFNLATVDGERTTLLPGELEPFNFIPGAGHYQEAILKLDAAKLEQLGLKLGDVAKLFTKGNPVIPGTAVPGDGTIALHMPTSWAFDAAQLAKVQVALPNGGTVPVSELATVGNVTTGTFPVSDWTVTWDMDPVMIAAGMIMGVRVTTWMFISGIALAWLIGPFGWESVWMNEAAHKMVTATSHPAKAWKEIGIWLGVPIMVSSSLLAFAFQWRTIARAFSGFFSKDENAVAEDPRITATEVPMSWFVWGVLISGSMVVAVGHFGYGIPWYYGVLAVGMTFFLSLVAARATGESDVTPTGAMGKIMQLTYGTLIPQSTTVNLMTANITSNAAVSCADLLNDLKSGYLLGANPRRQFIAQGAGILTGTIAMVGGFYLLVPDATTLNGVDGHAAQFPAPAAQSWKAVAELMKYGIAGMHPVYQQAIVLGGAIGVVLTLGEQLLPASFKRFWPSATGIGLGLILPFLNPLSMFVGSVAAWAWERGNKASSDDYMIPVASGVIAGISIIGVLAAFVNNVFLAG